MCKISAFNLKTENVVNPIGIGSISPKFSWKILSDSRCQIQSAYRVAVSKSCMIEGAKADIVWDSGYVRSSDTLYIPYEGKALQSCCRYHWAVTVWDGDGNPSGWSETQFFETGMLHDTDWQGEWICNPPQECAFSDSSWIWNSNSSCEKVLFYKSLNLPNEPHVMQAWFDGTADYSFTLYVNSKTVAKSNPEWGQKYTSPFCWVDFSDALHPGSNLICCEAQKENGNGGFIGKFRMLFSDGSETVIKTDGSWKTADAAANGCKNIKNNLSEMENAAVIGPYGTEPWEKPMRRGAAPMFRKEFTVNKGIDSARLYICGLGYYDLTVNGRKPDDSLLNPSYTQFSKRVYYVTHDVTTLLARGENCVGIELGRGYYACGKDWIGDGSWLDVPKLILQLNIRYADGTSEIIASREDFLVSCGPTFDDSIWYGEKYNANYERKGWNIPGYDISGWIPACKATPPAGKLETCMIDPIRIEETLKCLLIGIPKQSCYVYDAGKTTAGWGRVTVCEPKNTRIKITYGEHLRENGVLDIWKDGCDFQFWETPQVDYYICKGGSEEVWEPRFSYKGFRYIQIEGIHEACTVEARVFHSSVSQTGHFQCSNKLFNDIHNMVTNSILNNLHSIPTDTPMHEKRGWTGDGQVIADCASMNFSMLNFFSKWTQDIEDTQDETGVVSHTCPGPSQYAPTPAWMSALILVPWTLYRFYGDASPLAAHYDAFRKYLKYEIDRLNGGLSSDRYYGDWCTPEGSKGPEGSTLFATVYVYHACDIMSQIAALLGFTDDASYYSGIAGKIRDAVNEKFLDAEKGFYHTEIKTGYRQTSNVLPLAFGMVPQNLVGAVVDGLAEDIMVTRNVHLSTGCFGTKYLAPVLSEHGHIDDAYALACQRTFPSWGFWIDNGATACLEGWGMNVRSFDHYFLGTIDEWFYTHVAGIKPLEPGFRRITVKPYLSDTLTDAMAELHTVRGIVSSQWSRTPSGLKLHVRIPANTSAEVWVPASPESTVLESGKPAAESEGIRFISFENGWQKYRTESGDYSFEVLNQ